MQSISDPYRTPCLVHGLITSFSVHGSGEPGSIIHRIRFLTHASHPSINKFPILFLESLGAILGHVKLKVKRHQFILDVLYSQKSVRLTQENKEKEGGDPYIQQLRLPPQLLIPILQLELKMRPIRRYRSHPLTLRRKPLLQRIQLIRLLRETVLELCPRSLRFEELLPGGCEEV